MLKQYLLCHEICENASSKVAVLRAGTAGETDKVQGPTEA